MGRFIRAQNGCEIKALRAQRNRGLLGMMGGCDWVEFHQIFRGVDGGQIIGDLLPSSYVRIVCLRRCAL